MTKPRTHAPKTYVAVVLDRSGSMDIIRQATINSFNKMVEEIKKQSGEMETTVSLFTFSNRAHTTFFNADVNTLKPLTLESYKPDGLTALFDGVGLCINMLLSVKDANDPNVAFLVMVITDGEENHSTEMTAPMIVQLLKDTQSTDRWTFAFQLPPGRGRDFANRYGIPTDNIREWAATQEGMRAVQHTNSVGVAHYFSARASGQSAVKDFYVTTDMSKVSDKDVKLKLDDISDHFKVLEVPKEEPVKDFIERKTGKPYVIGSAYYQLMKTERVQPTKAVLIMEKGKKAIWGGQEARKLIGLPDSGNAKVNPGNHSSYDIYIQSASVNRKLPRGTKVLLDTKKTTDDMPTWDHTAVDTSQAATIK